MQKLLLDKKVLIITWKRLIWSHEIYIIIFFHWWYLSYFMSRKLININSLFQCKSPETKLLRKNICENTWDIRFLVSRKSYQFFNHWYLNFCKSSGQTHEMNHHINWKLMKLDFLISDRVTTEWKHLKVLRL